MSLDREALAELLYRAYWAPTAAMTGRAIAAWSTQHEAEMRAWRSVADTAIATAIAVLMTERDRS